MDVGLDVFTEYGFEGATLREVARRLNITRPALYYHVASKADLLGLIQERLTESLGDILTDEQPPSARNRAALLARVARLVDEPGGRFARFAAISESAMRELTAFDGFRAQMRELTERLAPTDDLQGRMRARLALTALFMSGARQDELGGSAEQRSDAAHQLAASLLQLAAP